jgi:hypothetical protein
MEFLRTGVVTDCHRGLQAGEGRGILFAPRAGTNRLGNKNQEYTMSKLSTLILPLLPGSEVVYSLV